jgi:HAD superfamily hydrolase (TIGR01549 family)
MNKKLFIFDADGTLFDTDQAIFETWKMVGEKLNIKTFEEYQDYTNMVKNIGWQQFFRSIGFDPKTQIPVVTDIFEEIGPEIFAQKANWFKNAKSTIEELEESGHQVAIATNSVRAVFQPFLDTLNNDLRVHDTRSHLAKPEPDMILDHIKNFGATPENTYMIGDSTTDIIAGTKANVKTCLARYGTHLTKEQISNHKTNTPDFKIDNIIDCPSDILSIQ